MTNGDQAANRGRASQMSKEPYCLHPDIWQGNGWEPYASYMNKRAAANQSESRHLPHYCQIPTDVRFVISVGFLGDQVETIWPWPIPIAASLLSEVDNFDKPGSRPGYSLICCYRWLQKPLLLHFVRYALGRGHLSVGGG